MNLHTITTFFKKTGNSYNKVARHYVVRHWLFLLALFFVLLCVVGIAGFFLYRYFVLDTNAFLEKEAEQKNLFDEKKLKAVIERFEKRTIQRDDGGTSTQRFIDPSIPF